MSEIVAGKKSQGAWESRKNTVYAAALFVAIFVLGLSSVSCSGTSASVAAASKVNPNAVEDAAEFATETSDGEVQRGSVADSSWAMASSILAEKCVDCHGTQRTESGLSVSNWKAVMTGSDYGEAVIPFDPDNSLLVELASQRVGGAHPGEFDADTLTSAEIEALRRWIGAGAPSADGAVAFAASKNLVYVANQGEASVSIIDAEANVVARRVDLSRLGFSKTAKPHHIAVEGDGSHWYVSLIGENRVLKLDRDNRLVGKVELEVPGLLVLDEQTDRLYVGRSMSAVNAPSSIGVIGLSTGQLEEIDVFFPRPHALAVAPPGRFVYSASLAENTIAAINAETFETELIRLGGNPEVLVQFAVSPDGLMMIAGGQLSGDIHFFDISNPPWLTRTGWTTVGLGAWHPVFSRDGTRAFVPNKMVNTVTVLNMSTREVDEVISGDGLAEPHGASLSPDGRYLYVSNNNLKGTYRPRHDLEGNANVGTVVVIDTRTSEIVKVLEVGSNATGIGSRRGGQ